MDLTALSNHFLCLHPTSSTSSTEPALMVFFSTLDAGRALGVTVAKEEKANEVPTYWETQLTFEALVELANSSGGSKTSVVPFILSSFEASDLSLRGFRTGFEFTVGVAVGPPKGPHTFIIEVDKLERGTKPLVTVCEMLRSTYHIARQATTESRALAKQNKALLLEHKRVFAQQERELYRTKAMLSQSSQSQQSKASSLFLDPSKRTTASAPPALANTVRRAPTLTRNLGNPTKKRRIMPKEGAQGFVSDSD